jgi:hypothetical protein
MAMGIEGVRMDIISKRKYRKKQWSLYLSFKRLQHSKASLQQQKQSQLHIMNLYYVILIIKPLFYINLFNVYNKLK